MDQGKDNDYDEEDDEDSNYRKRKRRNSNQKNGLDANNTMDMFAQMYQKEQENYDVNLKKAEVKKEKEIQYEENKKKLEAISKKKPQQHYENYDFENDVTYFTDFMQSQMSTKYNQLTIPHSNINQEGFRFFNKGREMWNISSQFKDDLEDKLRFQLEAADLLQGFQVTADSNSGHGSLALNTISYFLKDEAPKAPVYLFAIKNENKFNLSNGLSDAEITNF